MVQAKKHSTGSKKSSKKSSSKKSASSVGAKHRSRSSSSSGSKEKKGPSKKVVVSAKSKVDDRQARIRRDAAPEKVFFLVNGQQVKNVKELADVLERIEDHVFRHHVNEDKHDFAVWLRDVFGEIELAERLAKVKEKDHVQLVLYKHISHHLW